MKTGITIQKCNVKSAVLHNKRSPEYMESVNNSPNKHYSIFEDETCKNLSWENPVYRGKSLEEILDDKRNLYKQNVGQVPQENDRVREITDKKTGLKKTVTTAGWSPIREGICPVKAETTIEDFNYLKDWVEFNGIHIIRIDIHHDEGYEDPVSGERKYNHHAHIIFDWVNTEGKTIKLNKNDTSDLQDAIATSLGMERGVSKEITGAEHLTPAQMREKKSAEHLVKYLKESQAIGLSACKTFDDCLSFGVNASQDEMVHRADLERDCTAKPAKDILHQQEGIFTHLRFVLQSIDRMTKKIKELSAKVYLLPKKRIAHEAEIQAKMDENQRQTRDLKVELQKRLKSAKNAEIEAQNNEIELSDRLQMAKNAEMRAKNKEIELSKKIKEVEGQLQEQFDKGMQAGIDTTKRDYKPIIEENEKLKKTKAEWLEDFRTIGKKLTSLNDESVALLEKMGLRDAIGTNIWDEEKEKNQKKKQQQQDKRGPHF